MDSRATAGPTWSWRVRPSWTVGHQLCWCCRRYTSRYWLRPEWPGWSGTDSGKTRSSHLCYRPTRRPWRYLQTDNNILRTTSKCSHLCYRPTRYLEKGNNIHKGWPSYLLVCPTAPNQQNHTMFKKCVVFCVDDFKSVQQIYLKCNVLLYMYDL